MTAFALLLLFFQSGDLLDAVNQERGGRHWIDQKPAPPKSPEEQLACFSIEPGSRIEVVAAEPLVFDPVWIDFDHRGKMFVAEYSDYPIGPVRKDGTADENAAPLSRIVMLEDTNGDGRMDKRTMFADKLKFCHSFMPLMGGILAGAQTEILFLKDTDGDEVADLREVWFDGFTPAHPQMQIGCPRWGIDGRIYLTYAPGNVRCRRPGFETDKPVKMPRQDMRFDPVTMEFETVSGLGQFGNTIDNKGNRFFCTNRNPIMMEMIPHQVALKYPGITAAKRHTDVGPSGGDTKVFPLVAMKSNWLSHAGTHTSACGVTAYRGNLWNAEFRRSVFACEPVGHLVTRSIIESQKDSPALTSRRARPDADFLASSDTWFRPASMRTGPDGALYLADMYRMWVEHPKFLPPDIAARIDWRAGEDRGRIWRIAPESGSEDTFQVPSTDAELISLLNDANGWKRQMAHERLVTSAKANIVPQIREWLGQGQSDPAVRIGASILASRGNLNAGDLDRFRPDAANGQHTVDTLKMQLSTGAEQLAGIKRCAKHENPGIRFKAVIASLSDGLISKTEQESVLRSIILKDAHDPWFAGGLLMASAEDPLFTLGTLCDGAAELTRGTADLINRLAELAARTGNQADIVQGLNRAHQVYSVAPWVTAEILRGMARGLPRNADKSLAKQLAVLLASPPEEAEPAAAFIRTMLTKSASEAVDRSVPANRRLSSISLLPLLTTAEITRSIKALLSPRESGDIQRAAINLARQSGGADAADVILANWKHLLPTVRSGALEILMSRSESTKLLLNEMKAGRIQSSAVAIDQRVRLLQHRDASLKQLAVEIFGGVVSTDRQSVADQYKDALTLKASAERGAAVFKKTCIKCHRIDGQGANVGPDISDTRNRSRDALLYDILDPNRRVDPQFSEYQVLTTDGRSFSGLLVSDTEQQIVLRQPEGKERTILRADIEEFQVTSRSLMPVGIEKDVTVQQMADLLEFLKAR